MTAVAPDGSKRRALRPRISYLSESCADLLGVDRQATIAKQLAVVNLGTPASNHAFAVNMGALGIEMVNEDGTVRKERRSRTFAWTSQSGRKLKLTGVLDGRTTVFYSNRMPTFATFLFEELNEKSINASCH